MTSDEVISYLKDRWVQADRKYLDHINSLRSPDRFQLGYSLALMEAASEAQVTYNYIKTQLGIHS